MSTTSLELLGDVCIIRANGSRVALGRRQPRTVFALLVDQRHRVVSRSEIADVLWEDELPDHWAGAVRGVVAKVRSFLKFADADHWLVSSGDGWRFELPADVVVDVERCRAVIERAEGVVGAGTGAWVGLTADLSDIETALATELVPIAHGAWIDRRREDAERLRRRALAALIACARAAGRPDVAADASRSLLREDPYSDAAVRALMTSLIDLGDRVGALALFDEFGRRLHDELGVGPDAETEALSRSIRGLARPAPTDAGPWRAAAASIVGRDRQLVVLREEWERMVAGSGARSILVTGDPGVGKTRLAIEAARFVNRGNVLWGRCSPDRRVSFEPVVEALERTFRRDRSALGALGPLSAELASLLPELVPAVGSSTPSERSQLFRAITAAVRASITAPSVWVVDDVQWANDDTVALLTHLVGALADLDVLLVLTSRGHSSDVAHMLTAAARALPLTTVALGGLDLGGVVDLLAATGVVDAPQVGEVVLARTGGNPFFIRELVRSTDAEGRLDPLTVPATLQSWIEQRVARLGDSTRETLAAASVLGDSIDLAELAIMVNTDALGALDRCRPLVAEGLLIERDGLDGVDLAFTHALTRAAVHDGLGPARSRLLHRRAADAVRSVRPTKAWSDIAGHLAQAGPAADADAVPAMLAAGHDALAQLAWVSARDWFTEVVERRPAPGRERAQALIGAGTAGRSLGDRNGAHRALSEALAIASDLSAARLVAEASLGLVGGGARGVSEAMPDQERAQLLRTAIGGLGPDDDDLKVAAQLELALALLLTDHVDERVRLAEDALERARRLGRDDLLGSALLGFRVARPGPEHAEGRLRDIDEVLAIDRGSRSHAVTVGALMARHEDALIVGDRTLARAALAAADLEVESSGHPYWRWVVRTWQALGMVIDGDLDSAEAVAFEALPLQADHPESMACLGVNLVDIRLFQGQPGAMVDLLAVAANENPQIPCYRAVLALCLAEDGRLDAAAAEYRQFSAMAFGSIPDDTNRLLTLAVLAEVAADLDDHNGAAVLMDLLSPHAGRQVVLNCFGGGGAYWGPVALQLGRLAATIGDRRAAVTWLEQAAADAASFGAPLVLGRIEHLAVSTIG